VDAHENSRKLEKVTQALLEKEREGSSLREQFIAVLGHDLRNPLASISGGLRLLKKDQPAEKRKLLLEMLDGSVVRMSILIDNVLDFARGRLGGGIPLAIAPGVLLTPVLEQVVAELRLGVPDRVIETSFDTPNPIRCDPSRLGQLVSNLLGNALTHGAPDVPVRIHAAANAEGLTIWVANGGEPISPEGIERLFQPFFRGEVRPSQQGLGLGLHIASEIAKAHGGRLNVVSTAAETRFTFQMPAPAD
jgi:sigma-B regulation protein RsbU (phosphoserine phosphatase)